jgi:hypothetical protein
MGVRVLTAIVSSGRPTGGYTLASVSAKIDPLEKLAGITDSSDDIGTWDN